MVLRRCISCYQKDSTNFLIRICILNGKALIDDSCLISSRGIYIHKNNQCLFNKYLYKKLNSSYHKNGSNCDRSFFFNKIILDISKILEYRSNYSKLNCDK